ncbi:hypothetical protein [Kushneria marisflavi]|uniref:Uncharacterized protein n=1 Tax=Kushneria marisflavi TaxID=157779 RepID=A0A240ULA9_9GAMM|nr:hypothetical protein [Kushneria marisflavi]ART61916.1 hypothetical protein B9H00_01570 [Kushneria marisflavi]RKD86963.1 hypothetical protein C8D96_0418 [Kushneria marisflavi]
MSFPSVFSTAYLYPCILLLSGLLTACSTAPQGGQGGDTLVVAAGATDEPTARANAMETGQHLCLSRGGRQASMVDMQVTPPTMTNVDKDPLARSNTDALEAATSEGDIWRARLTLRCR